MTLADVADDLYAAPLDDFTSSRDERAAQARRDGDRELAAEVKRLRKPAASAWAVNQLVRHRRDEVEQLLDLGASMREAQDDLDRDTLRTLTQQRRKVVAALAARAATLADDLGHGINAAAIADVEQTLQAAMTDPDAADAVRTAVLIRPLATTGFDPVDLDGALALVGASSSPSAATAQKATTRSDAAARELAEARAKAEETEAWARESEAALAAIDERLADAEKRRRTLESREDALLRQLDDIRESLAAVDDETGDIDSDRESASRAARSARRSADRARDRAAYLS